MTQVSDDVVRVLLDILSAKDPMRLSKARLYDMRTQVIETLTRALIGDPLPSVRYGEPDPRWWQAMQCALTYQGRNHFMRDLRRYAETHSTLSPAQVDAVLAPPQAEQIEQLRQVGVDPETVPYRWQVIDVVREASTRLKEKLS